MTKEEIQDLIWNEDESIEIVCEESETGWRHGSYETRVVLVKGTGEYWMVSYTRQTDGEYDGLREGDFDLVRVVPKVEIVETTKWLPA